MIFTLSDSMYDLMQTKHLRIFVAGFDANFLLHF